MTSTGTAGAAYASLAPRQLRASRGPGKSAPRGVASPSSHVSGYGCQPWTGAPSGASESIVAVLATAIGNAVGSCQRPEESWLEHVRACESSRGRSVDTLNAAASRSVWTRDSGAECADASHSWVGKRPRKRRPPAVGRNVSRLRYGAGATLVLAQRGLVIRRCVSATRHAGRNMPRLPGSSAPASAGHLGTCPIAATRV